MPDPIADFYEAHPYPPAVTSLDSDVTAWADGSRRRFEHARTWPTLAHREEISILVAGCGTAQAARWAARFPRADVIGIDISERSLEASQRLADKYELRRLEHHQLPIESVGELRASFDLVVCTGVLHHLADPGKGLRALTDVLVPAGALRLMVYARHGRVGIEMIQQYARHLGLQATADDIDDLVAALRELPADHPIRPLLASSPDFQDRGALADALLNPRERSYSVPELLTELDGAGLRFERWVHQAPYRPQCGAITETPHGARVSALADRDQFAAMELYRGTITRHSLIASRSDSVLPSVESWRQDWHGVVPLLAPTVRLVEDRLPPGAAVAVVNQAHVDRDLVLFLTAAERAAVDEIDGRRTAADITGATEPLLARLWEHDAIVFAGAG